MGIRIAQPVVPVITGDATGDYALFGLRRLGARVVPETRRISFYVDNVGRKCENSCVRDGGYIAVSVRGAYSVR